MADPLDFDPIAEAGRQWREHFGAAPVPAMMAVTSVMRVQQILLAALNQRLAAHNLTFARYEALMLVYFSRAGSLPLGKIGSRLQVHPTSVTNLIDGLERHGYVERAPHPTDRRTTLATVTPEGRVVAEQATAGLQEMSFGLEALSRQGLEAITELLERVRLDAGDFQEN